MLKQFGGRLTTELKNQYAQSNHWLNGRFQNLEETSMNIDWRTLPVILYKQFFKTKGRVPKQPLPIPPFNREMFFAEPSKAQMVWYGHSAILMRIMGKTILIDPMLGADASPIAPFKTKRFSPDTLKLVDDFPTIDLMLLSHDHYDHLDLASLLKLKPKIRQYYVALGCARHLKHWGISESNIKEFDWWQHSVFEGIEITFTPSRHFSGRGLTDRSQSLWGGWAIKTPHENIYFSGDGGYGKHFKQVGDRLGPFDFGFMECGQYNENWHQIHMFPQEAVLAAKEAKVSKAMPVHWGAFALAQHSWTEPAEQFVAAGRKDNLMVTAPPPGQIFGVTDTHDDAWWADHV
jgi:L-ascorbate metabolism protein UlaG (beta-lactamase superfamily)